MLLWNLQVTLPNLQCLEANYYLLSNVTELGLWIPIRVVIPHPNSDWPQYNSTNMSLKEQPSNYVFFFPFFWNIYQNDKELQQKYTLYYMNKCPCWHFYKLWIYEHIRKLWIVCSSRNIKRHFGVNQWLIAAVEL